MRGAILSTCSGLLLAAAPSVFVIESVRRGDRTALSPGPATMGHAHIATACAQCHSGTSGDVQDACIRCHGGGMQVAHDSHPAALFDDPVRAEMLERIDVTRCATCHLEHRPHLEERDWPHAQSVTVRATVCVECHADVLTARASHSGFERSGCSAVGCHHYHDNRALYERKLRAHLDDPAVLPSARAVGPFFGPSVENNDVRDGDPFRAPKLDALAAAPDDGTPVEVATSEWRASQHAKAGVGCASCHQASAQHAPDPASDPARDQAWEWRPGTQVCARCHDEEDSTFAGGKHGMRLAAGLPALTTREARLPMKTAIVTAVNAVGAHHANSRELTCSTCHVGHRYDAAAAAVSACEGCHDDQHTRSYRGSIHFVLWRKEADGDAPAGSGVSCATCHMPRLIRADAPKRYRVDHNQNRNLRPRDKMAEGVCGSCHGLPFTLASLADDRLVRRNFAGAASATVFTGLDLIRNSAAASRGSHRGGSP